MLKLPLLVEKSCNGANLTVWTSTLEKNPTDSFSSLSKKLQWKALDELDAGECDGMTYEEIEQKFPDDFKARTIISMSIDIVAVKVIVTLLSVWNLLLWNWNDKKIS